MATRRCLFLYVSANGLILLANLPNGLLALILGSSFEPGKSSFSPLQKDSFWTSDGGNYTFGFKEVIKEASSTDYLLSIWLSDDPNKTALWWPQASSNENDDDPTVKEDALFQYSSKGSLELYSVPNGSLLWGTNTTSSYAKLHDTGNLVLFYDNSSSAISSWQSFQDSRDSLMLAGLDSITVTSKSPLLQARRNQSSYATDRGFRLQTDADENVEFHGRDYSGKDFKYATAKMSTTRESFLITLSDHSKFISGNASNVLERLTLDYDGNLRIYQWDSSKSSWIKQDQLFEDMCKVGSPCGPFGICQKVDADGKENCTCPSGFYKIMDHSQVNMGCESPIRFNESCNLRREIRFEEVRDTDYYFNDLKNETTPDLQNCQNMCLDDCECIAFVYVNTPEGNISCFFKAANATGYLMNGYNSTGKTLLIKVLKSQEGMESHEAIESHTPHKKRNWLIGVGVAAAAAVLVVVCFGALLSWRRRNIDSSSVLPIQTRKRKFEVAGDVHPVRHYRHDELVAATCNFSEPLGQGGFGTVFKGMLTVENTGFGTEEMMGSNVFEDQQMRAVAVKVLKSFQGNRDHNESYYQFKAEIYTLGKVHHVNLVSLLGYSYDTTGVHEARMLVYECMEKGSLDKYLWTDQYYAEPKLSWRTRYSIALGIARGMAYLHHDCSPPILHCDIKPHNILLDANFTAKVADFGFARRVHLQHPNSHIILSSVRGTHGYLAPEWLTNDDITFKVDVYSFGKLLLELVRGFKMSANDLASMPLVEWAMQCMSQEDVLEFSVHPDIQAVENSVEIVPLPHNSQQEAIEKLRLLKVGMWCIQHKASARPTMARVVHLIEGTMSMQEDPPSIPTPSKLPIPSSSQSFSAGTYQDRSLSGR